MKLTRAVYNSILGEAISKIKLSINESENKLGVFLVEFANEILDLLIKLDTKSLSESEIQRILKQRLNEDFYFYVKVVNVSHRELGIPQAYDLIPFRIILLYEEFFPEDKESLIRLMEYKIKSLEKYEVSNG